ncbi:hypothetical protein E1I69_00190 [Bacillus timonensis]|uniref:SPOR domain-containing protein n=1 Tax=Bacillus timonensis TaxID=1033734 RepID=A0A4V3V8I7_9BACI|nr:SPOR domain-containing protein [Bacillus timonensis]THE15303.1 hypothetical protein E1I69_00190 [Bacillus timonensis]
MDKHNRISIKINGRESKVKKEEKETPDFVESEKPQIIVENDEVAAAQEEEESDFSWVLPDESLKNHSSKEKDIPVIPIEDLRHTKGPSKLEYIPKKKKGFQLFSLKQFSISIVLAIVLGIGFGIMILKIVEDVNAGPAQNEAPSQSTNEAPSSSGKQEDTPDTPASNPVAIDLETLSTGVVQGGRFSTAENANTRVDEIKGKGFAAATVKMDGAFYVIAGIGAEQSSVSGMKTEYKEAFPDFFSKTYEVPGGSYTNAGKADSEAIKIDLPVFKELAALSSQAFGTGAIDNGQWENLTKQLVPVKEIKTDNLHEQLQKFHTDIQSAFTQLQKYKNDGDQKSLWQSQQSLLNAYQAYTVWISELS